MDNTPGEGLILQNVTLTLKESRVGVLGQTDTQAKVDKLSSRMFMRGKSLREEVNGFTGRIMKKFKEDEGTRRRSSLPRHKRNRR